MIIDWNANAVEASKYSVYDAKTGECLNRECIFYADDELGFYKRYITNDMSLKFLWDSRTLKPVRYAQFHEFTEVAWESVVITEVAWESVVRPIIIRLTADGPPLPQLYDEKAAMESFFFRGRS
jgi:hypothetical protein